MLPSWLFGKSKSKLIEELGGGGGTSYTAGDGIDISSGVISFDPSTMDGIPQSKVTNLDDSLAALTPKTALSNPNILHNPWFTVNQRDIPYDTLITTSAIGMFVDRWCVNTGCSYIYNSNGSITSKNYIDLWQILLHGTERYGGKKLTFSILTNEGVFGGTVDLPVGVPASNTVVNAYRDGEDLILNVVRLASGHMQLSIVCRKELTIRAAKLEIGEISTIQMDPRPEYALELAKCQRYFQRIKSSVSGQADNLSIGTAVTATQIIVPIPIAPMRATPTLAHSLLTVKSPQTGSSLTPTGILINTAATNVIMLSVNYSGGNITAGSPWYLQIGAGGHIDFSADI